uniref:BZIP domain-containing protein n=1 Tax=Clastoptera arizonana TaxID=38151 RepID=A0A1B6EA74_9HEMI
MKSNYQMDTIALGQEMRRNHKLQSEKWGEHFQDLSNWCQPNKMSNISSSLQSDEQLNTPIVTVQDEFDFAIRSSEGPLMSDVDCDLWDTTIPNTHGELWESVNDWLTCSPEPTIDDVNNTFLKKELVKYNGDFLLSQSPISCKIKMENTIQDTFECDKKLKEQIATKSLSIKSENTVNLFLSKPIKREPFFDMSSIFQSEEPFINDIDSSCTYIPDKLASPINIHRDDMVAAEEVVVTSEDTSMVIQEPIVETQRIQDTKVFVKTKPTAYILPEKHKKPAILRPKLKLDINAALMTTQAETMDTPEVLQPLVEGVDGFSLISFVCDDEMNMASSITGNSTNQTTCLTIPSQKRNENTKMPLGKYNTKTSKRKQVKPPQEYTEQPSTLMVSNRPKRKSAENFKLVSKKRRLTNDSDDIESLNSVDTSVVSDSDESFSVRSKSIRKKHTNKSNAGRKRKVSVIDSDLESVGSTSDRYRELRDRNNEASRKSRLNRKSKEIEMKAQALQLEKENRMLKIKADEMEKLVKKLRDNLMQIVLKRS